MVTLLEGVVGGLAVVLGLLWIVRPTAMMRYQTLVLYLGRVEPDEHQTDRERLFGRVGGAVLAALGLVLAFGLAP